MSTIQPLIWNKTGNDWVRDGLTGRLGAPELFGETIVSGATNAVAIRETADGSTFYIGSVNGGVYSRRYDKTTDTWDEQWTWISKPGSGYKGGQSIGALAVSTDGRYLAVGQGNPSNYNTTGAPSSGIQIGKIQEDGAIDWRDFTSETSDSLKGINIRSLDWQGSSVIATGWNTPQDGAFGSVALATLKGDHAEASIIFGSYNLQIEQLPTGDLIAAGYQPQPENISNNLFATDTDLSLNSLSGTRYTSYVQELDQNGYQITRVSAHPELINGKIILFVGSILNDAISRIDRLVLSPENLELQDVSTFKVENNTIGTGQGSNLQFYGNFSLAADPYDSSGQSVFAGGNGYWSSQPAQSLVTTGGLVRIGFQTETTPELTFLYGPRLENGEFKLSRDNPPAPGAPHADSRAISFFTGKDGPRLVQTDDGGIWQLNLTENANGSMPADKAWWKSLTTNGLNTFEVMMADWGSEANIISSSYQDNAASLGYHGDAFATNMWVGDGEIAVIDDGGEGRNKATGYLSGYHYLAYGSMQKYQYNDQGFVEGMQYVDFLLQPEPKVNIIPWRRSPEFKYYVREAVRKEQDNFVGITPFLLPFEENAYRQGSMVMTGSVNAYETIKVKGNNLVFRPLLEGTSPLLKQGTLNKQITALDNQGSAVQGTIAELYLATNEFSTGKVQLLGRGNSGFDADSKKGWVRPLTFSNLNNQQLSEAGPIIDIAHQPNETGADRTYWLQGGTSVLFSYGSINPQILRIGKENQAVKTFSLEELGLSRVDNDIYGFQSVTYIPGNKIHGEKIVIAGLSGAWISDLDSEGMPGVFAPMNWQGLPESVPPGSYINNVKYIPDDDLLILNTLGQGNWIYSFSGDLGERPAPRQLINLSDTVLPIQKKADLNKRGDEINQTIAFQLDSRLQNKDVITETAIVLHQPDKWRKYMEIASPYHVLIDKNTIDESARDRANNWLNILQPEALEYRGGYETASEIVMPFKFEPGISMFNLTINPKQFTAPNPVELDYTFMLADGSESVTRTLTLKPDRFHGKISRDVITGRVISRTSLIEEPESIDDLSATMKTPQHERRRAKNQNHRTFRIDPSNQLMSSGTTIVDDAFGQADSSNWLGIDWSNQNQLL